MPLLCRPSAFMWGHDVCLGRKDRLRQDRGRWELCFQGSMCFAGALGWARVAAALGRASAWAGLGGIALGPQKVPPCLQHIWSIFIPVLLKYKYKYIIFFLHKILYCYYHSVVLKFKLHFSIFHHFNKGYVNWNSTFSQQMFIEGQ